MFLSNNKIYLIIFFWIFFSAANLSPQNSKEEKFQNNDYSEIEKCVYLENQFLKKTKPILEGKIAKILNYGCAPIACSCLVSAFLYHFILKKQKLAYPKYLTAGTFLTTIILFYCLINFLTKPKEITDWDNLNNFIKDWPKNKFFSPEKFFEKFESFYSLYQKNNSLPFSIIEAEKIVQKIIMDTIDYKIYLRYKQRGI